MADHELHVLDCGTLTFPRSGIYFNGGDEIITVPIPAYLIKHPKGNVVYDTGFPLECVTDPPHFEEALTATFRQLIARLEGHRSTARGTDA